ASRTLTETIRSNSIQQGQNEKTLQTSIDQFHQEQRAWVVVYKIDPDGGQLKDGSYLAARVTFTNVGKTPALWMTIEMADNVYTADHKPDLRITREKGFQPHYLVMPPNDFPNSVSPRIK